MSDLKSPDKKKESQRDNSLVSYKMYMYKQAGHKTKFIFNFYQRWDQKWCFKIHGQIWHACTL